MDADADVQGDALASSVKEACLLTRPGRGWRGRDRDRRVAFGVDEAVTEACSTAAGAGVECFRMPTMGVAVASGAAAWSSHPLVRSSLVYRFLENTCGQSGEEAFRNKIIVEKHTRKKS